MIARLLCKLGYHRGVTINNCFVTCSTCGKFIEKLPEDLP